jgi:Acyl-CoA carboxylase epsilon subunit
VSGAIAVETTAEASGGDEVAVQAVATVPALTVVSGAPTAEELAALVVVLAALGGDAPEPAPVRRMSGWTDRSRSVRGGHTHGVGGWRAAAFPR